MHSHRHTRGLHHKHAMHVPGARSALLATFQVVAACTFICLVLSLMALSTVHGVVGKRIWTIALPMLPIATSIVATMAIAEICRYRRLMTLGAWIRRAGFVYFLVVLVGLGTPMYAVRRELLDEARAMDELLIYPVFLFPAMAGALCLVWHRWGVRWRRPRPR